MPVRDKLLINEKSQEPIAVNNGHLQRPIPTEKRQLLLRMVLLRMGIRLVAMDQLLREWAVQSTTVGRAAMDRSSGS